MTETTTDEATSEGTSGLTITQWAEGEVEKANAAGKQPIVSSGLWLLPDSWSLPRGLPGGGYLIAAPGSPGDPRPPRVEGAPRGVAQESWRDRDHYEEAIGALDKKPAIMGLCSAA